MSKEMNASQEALDMMVEAGGFAEHDLRIQASRDALRARVRDLVGSEYKIRLKALAKGDLQKGDTLTGDVDYEISLLKIILEPL